MNPLRGSASARTPRHLRPASTLPTLLAAFALLTLGACKSDTVADPIIAAKVVVTPGLVSKNVGQTQQLAVQAVDASGATLSTDNVAWTSLDPVIATVSSTGLVTILRSGGTAIVASTRGATGFASIDAIGNIAAINIIGVLTVGIGQTSQLSATSIESTGRELFRTVAWSSANPSIATVSASGLVTTTGVGSTVLSAAAEGKIGSITFTVLPPPAVATVAIVPATGFSPTTIGVPLSLTLKDAQNNVVTNRVVGWTSSSEALATISSLGVLTGTGVGNVTITATSEGKSGTATYRVRTGLKSGVPVTFANTNNDADGSLFTAAILNPNTDFNTISSFAIYVPAGTTTLRVTLGGGTGDPDLYLFRPGNLTTTDDCHSYADGPSELCTVANPAAGVWRVAVDPYIAHANTVITVTITPTPP